MKVAVTGASGLIGAVAVPPCAATTCSDWCADHRGPADEVVGSPGRHGRRRRARRRRRRHPPGRSRGWRPPVDRGYKREIHDTRVLGTGTIAAAMAALDPRPACWCPVRRSATTATPATRGRERPPQAADSSPTSWSRGRPRHPRRGGHPSRAPAHRTGRRRQGRRVGPAVAAVPAGRRRQDRGRTASAGGSCRCATRSARFGE